MLDKDSTPTTSRKNNPIPTTPVIFFDTVQLENMSSFSGVGLRLGLPSMTGFAVRISLHLTHR
jgi:hypothetical protein